MSYPKGQGMDELEGNNLDFNFLCVCVYVFSGQPQQDNPSAVQDHVDGVLL